MLMTFNSKVVISAHSHFSVQSFLLYLDGKPSNQHNPAVLFSVTHYKNK